MFKTKLINSREIIYNDFADKVLFNVEEGQVGVLTHHIDYVFKAVPSICYVFLNGKKSIFYIGYGVAKCKNNEFYLTSSIISTPEDYEKECCEMSKYGELCLKNFKRFGSVC